MASLKSITNSITTEAFLNTLLDNISRLPLLAKDFYRRSSSVQSLSFDSVFSCFESDFGKHLTWDYVMNQIVMLSIRSDSFVDEGMPESPKSIDLNELVYISRFSNSSPDIEDVEQRLPRVGDLRIPQTPPGLRGENDFTSSVHHREFSASSRISLDASPYANNGRSAPLRLPDFHESIQKIQDSQLITFSEPQEEIENSRDEDVYKPQGALNLSGKKMTSLKQILTSNILILNLSNNRFSKIPHFGSVNNLEVLDLSWNLLETVQGLSNLKLLKELYLSHNLITKMNTLSQNECLALVDISSNKIQQFQCFAALAQNKRLRVLSVTGNKILKSRDFKRNVEALLPQIIVLNPENILEHSTMGDNKMIPRSSSIADLRNLTRSSVRDSVNTPFKLINKKK